MSANSDCVLRKVYLEPSGGDQWNDSSWSRSEDREHQSWGGDWTHHGQRWDTEMSTGWHRRTSWDATTAATGVATDRCSTGSEDPWSHGRDPWTGARGEERQARDHGWPGPRGDPWADGRAGRVQGSDSGDRGSGPGAGAMPTRTGVSPGMVGRTTTTAASRVAPETKGASQAEERLRRSWRFRLLRATTPTTWAAQLEAIFVRSRPDGG